MDEPSYRDTIRIFYIHGRYDNPESIILTERDYTNRYQEGSLATKCLWFIAATKQVVFIGFGFRDFDLLSAFRQVRGEFGGGDPRHFALVGIKPKEEGIICRNYLRDKFGIEPIFYEIIEEKHKEHNKLHERIIKILGDIGLTPSLPNGVGFKYDSIVEDVEQLQEYITKAYELVKSGKSK